MTQFEELDLFPMKLNLAFTRVLNIVHGETALLVAYVDDLLLCCQSARSEKRVEKAIGKAAPLKETGLVLPAEQGGGALTFIGRRIQRGATDDSLSIGVDPKFLDTTFVEFSVNKGSNTVPDVASVLERALTDKSMQQPLTAAAYSMFRRALRKLLWMAQSRHDLKLFLSLIGSQQAAPTHGTGMAIKVSAWRCGNLSAASVAKVRGTDDWSCTTLHSAFFFRCFFCPIPIQREERDHRWCGFLRRWTCAINCTPTTISFTFVLRSRTLCTASCVAGKCGFQPILPEGLCWIGRDATEECAKDSA